MTEQTVALPDVPPAVDINSRRSRKMAYYSATISKKIFLAERETTLLLSNPTLRRIMKPYSYNDEKIAEFVQIYKETANAQVLQNKELGEKAGAYAEFEKLYVVAKSQMHYLIKVAKLAFRDNEHALTMLLLNESMRKYRTIDGMMGYMRNFYQNALRESSVYETLAKYNYSRTTLQLYYEHMTKCSDAYTALSKESADVLRATRVRDKNLALLDEWMYEYYSFMKIAYELNPDWLSIQQAEELFSNNEQ